MKRVDIMQRLGSLAGLATVIALVGSTAVSAQAPVVPKPSKAVAKSIPPSSPVKLAAASAQGYSVVLVLGDMQNASAGDGNVPPAARKALADMKDFLPYKSYRLLDAQWMLGSHRTVSRLRGPNDQEYQLTLRGVPAGEKLNVTFRLAEPGAATLLTASDNNALAARLAALQNALRDAQANAARARDAGGDRRNEAIADANEKAAKIAREIVQTEQQTAMKEATIRATHAVIDTSFTMDVGETVVVGTSRVAGDKALIALLTAVGQPGR
jgi:hypothetical protein